MQEEMYYKEGSEPSAVFIARALNFLYSQQQYLSAKLTKHCSQIVSPPTSLNWKVPGLNLSHGGKLNRISAAFIGPSMQMEGYN
jgi:hypothetical protein